MEKLFFLAVFILFEIFQIYEVLKERLKEEGKLGGISIINSIILEIVLIIVCIISYFFLKYQHFMYIINVSFIISLINSVRDKIKKKTNLYYILMILAIILLLYFTYISNLDYNLEKDDVIGIFQITSRNIGIKRIIRLYFTIYISGIHYNTNSKLLNKREKDIYNEG